MSVDKNRTIFCRIGVQFMSSGRHPKLCTVTDILRTYNSKNELVKVRYVAAHKLMGQTVYDHDVVETTIRKGIVS